MQELHCEFDVADATDTPLYLCFVDAQVYGAAFVLVKDLTSTNGTFLNGRMIAYGRLADGDELRIGDSRLVVSIDRRPR